MTKLWAVLIIALLLVGRPLPKLKHDLERDAAIIHSDHSGYNKDFTLVAFYRYAELDFSKFKFSDYRLGKHYVQHWVRKDKDGLSVFQISTQIHVDTVLYINAVSLTGKKTSIAAQRDTLRINRMLKYRSYVIKPKTGKTLVYITGENSGLYKYYIGGKLYAPVYEAVETPDKYPQLSELLAVTIQH